MKKVMFAFAAVAAMAAVADIQSDNVVGFANKNLQFGYTLTGPNFLSVGSDKVALENLKVTGYTAGALEDAVNLQVLDYQGTTTATYDWLDLDGDFEPGWYIDYESVESGTVNFSVGDGLFVQGIDGIKLETCGEVAINKAVSVPLQFGYTIVANPFPVPVNLLTLSISGYTAGALEDAVNLQVLDYQGTTTATYDWLDLDGDFEPGWYIDYEPIEEEVLIQPGQAFFSQGIDGAVVNFPALVL